MEFSESEILDSKCRCVISLVASFILVGVYAFISGDILIPMAMAFMWNANVAARNVDKQNINKQLEKMIRKIDNENK